jgi:putative CocE/NonD family hydrolase
MTQAPIPREARIRVRDGIEIGAAIYAPEAGGRYPALLAASPYRYDNNVLPASPQFLWRRPPIDSYVRRGYAYVHMDVRGSGKSAGEFGFWPQQQNDLYDVIEWIAKQPWSNGKVGGIGQSYYCMSQWLMGAMARPRRVPGRL